MRKALKVDSMKAGGHYSHAVIANGMVFVSGQGPVDPATGKMSDNFAEQIRQTIRNLQTILKAAGGLIIETRTSNPASPAAGQIWLRTDLP